jgi:RNA polymerase sigma-70 factor (ECF subfamily)
MGTPDIKRLARLLRDGDEPAFEEFVRLFSTPAYRLAQRVLRNQDDALEVVQEALVAAYEGRARFSGTSHPRSWLLSITYNRAVDRLKERNRFDPYDETASDHREAPTRAVMVRHITDWWHNPEQILSDQQLRAQLDTALGNLPPVSQAVFELREMQGMTSREVSETLNLSEAAVRVRLHRVRQFLMGALQDAFDRK